MCESTCLGRLPLQAPPHQEPEQTTCGDPIATLDVVKLLRPYASEPAFRAPVTSAPMVSSSTLHALSLENREQRLQVVRETAEVFARLESLEGGPLHRLEKSSKVPTKVTITRLGRVQPCHPIAHHLLPFRRDASHLNASDMFARHGLKAKSRL